MTPQSEEDRLDELSRRIEEWLSDSSSRAEALRALVARVRSEQAPLMRQAAPGPTKPSGDSAGLTYRFARDLDAAPDQSAILSALLTNTASVAGRALVLIVRGDNAIGWGSQGFATGFQARSVSIALGGSHLIARCHQRCAPVIEPPTARPGNAEILQRLGGGAPGRMMAAPVWVRDRVAAIVYADTGEREVSWMPDAICLMTSLAGLNLEVLPVRQKHPRFAGEPEVIVEEADGPATPAPDDAPAVAATVESVDPEQEALREEALRFARLLVSEIVLYNAAELEEGRRLKNIYARLKDEIDRSHQMFEERFSSRGPGANDFFRNELVRVLAEGDETALTLPWS